MIHHTQCGSGALADDTFRRRYAERIGVEESTLREHAVLDPAATVTRDVERLRSARRDLRARRRVRACLRRGDRLGGDGPARRTRVRRASPNRRKRRHSHVREARDIHTLQPPPRAVRRGARRGDRRRVRRRRRQAAEPVRRRRPGDAVGPGEEPLPGRRGAPDRPGDRRARERRRRPQRRRRAARPRGRGTAALESRRRRRRRATTTATIRRWSRATVARRTSSPTSSRGRTRGSKTMPAHRRVSSPASATCELGGAADRQRPGQHAGRSRPRARRAARVPVHLPALAAVLPLARRRRCCRRCSAASRSW